MRFVHKIVEERVKIILFIDHQPVPGSILPRFTLQLDFLCMQLPGLVILILNQLIEYVILYIKRTGHEAILVGEGKQQPL
jgi:hypothetical protein